MAYGWTDELPHDLEPLSEPGGSLRGRLSDGRDVVARVVSIRSGEEGGRLVADLRRVAGLGGDRLVPVLGAAQEPEAVWTIFELDAGQPLRTLLEPGALPVPLAAAAGIEILAGLAVLHEAGLTHGALHAGNVHVARDGHVRLGDYAVRGRRWAAEDREGSGGRRRDVTAAGALLCLALGVPERPDIGELRDAERTAPALVAAARALATGGGGRSAPAALATVRSAAGGLADPVQHRRHLRALGVLASGGEVPPEPPEPPEVLATSEPTPPPAGASPLAAELGRWRALPRPWLVALLAGAAAASALGMVLGVRAGHGVGPVATTRPPGATARLATPIASSTAAAAPPATAAPPADAAPAPAPQPSQGSAAGSPEAAVSSFYQLVGQHQFDAAVGLWSAHMRASYPPGENVYQRFADTTSLTLLRNQVSEPGPTSAVVSVDLVEVRGGRTYRWVGSWILVRQDSGWLLDQPSLRPG